MRSRFVALLLVLAFFLLPQSTTSWICIPLPSKKISPLLLSKKKEDSGNQQKTTKEPPRIPVGRKERYVRRETNPPTANTTTAASTIAQLEQECKNLKEQLRHDLFQLKRKQCQVAHEEDELLQQAVEEFESDRSVFELDIAAAKRDKQEVRGAVQQAQTKQRLAAQKWSQNEKAWLVSGGRDLRALFGLGEASADWKNSQEALAANKEVERQAQRREARAEALLNFLDEQEAALREISLDPGKEQLWAEEELSLHHQKSLLQVVAMEWETEKLWNQLREDLLELKRLQTQVEKEEALLTAKEAEIIAFQTREQKERIQEATAAMKKARAEVSHAVVKKEQAYKDTLVAIKEGSDVDPTLLWKLSEPAMELEESNKVEEAAKEKLTRLAAKEAQAEDLLTLLNQAGAYLKELRLPGREEALQKWIKDELSGHESMLEVVKNELIRFDH